MRGKEKERGREKVRGREREREKVGERGGGEKREREGKKLQFEYPIFARNTHSHSHCPVDSHHGVS